ncbi:hypothetical protein CHS0354_033332 [Potamilus streckersoni]|uniref:Uncharacterized protein n=1 Tax=Potamilus streckersoni TaxID=2493646 RepID=A0AAE0VJQ3_9BIVA|nr:hypothetical protein CHS0354_033332 [Potamilus streckersoni]
MECTRRFYLKMWVFGARSTVKGDLGTEVFEVKIGRGNSSLLTVDSGLHAAFPNDRDKTVDSGLHAAFPNDIDKIVILHNSVEG